MRARAPQYMPRMCADKLPRRTLDTLPINIAVIDEEGTIVYTNRAWSEFAGLGSDGCEMVGTNYFDGIDEDEDSFAAEATSGLEEVLAGERELFTMEYPCHTPTERQWFLMRASPLAESDDGEVVVAHIDITQRKLAELDAREGRRELEHLVSRIEGLLTDVVEGVLQARTRADIEEAVCARLSGVDPYVAAWTGRVDLAVEVLEPTAVAGFDPPADLQLPLEAAVPSTRAIREGTTQVEGFDGDQFPPFEGVVAASDGKEALLTDGLAGGQTDSGGGTVLAFPIVYKDTEYGVLTVYAATDAIDERELAVLETLARVVSTAINAVEGRRILAADRVVELELALTDEGPFYRDIAVALDCTLQYEGAVEAEDGTVSSLFVVRGAEAAAVEAEAAAHHGVEDVRQLSERDGEHVFEFLATERPLVDQLAIRGAETTDILASGRETRLTVELPAEADTRALLEGLAEAYPSIELLARRERERADRTRGELVADLEESLTDRQRLALQKAAIGGFFDWPRGVSGEELARSMDITPSTYHQHLRRAEQKVIETLFEW